MILLAEDRLNASIMISSSTRLSFTGAQVDWITKTSFDRTFSWISIWISPSLKVVTLAPPRGDLQITADPLRQRGLDVP